MLFSSLIFLIYFLPIFLLVFYVTRKNIKIQNIVLLIFSLLFYSFGEPVFILVMAASIILNYSLGLLINKYRKYSAKTLTLGIITNLSLLFHFKYFAFFINELVNPMGFNIRIDNLALPIGISFFTFQAISYLVDLHKKEIRVQKNFINLSLYISLFPQLIAGPIVRYIDIEKQITKRTLSYERTVSGLRIFILGLGKKVIIANYFGLIADTIFDMNLQETSPNLWYIAIFSYTMQIYFDFSGYSNMAIGISKMVGFDLKENFNYPYTAKSITDFWKRWHISLSSFLRDYLYIPLGGNKKGIARTYLNLFLVFFLCGLWHGSNWTFITWGIYFAIFLIIERMFLLKILIKLPSFLSWTYTITIVIFGWLIFRIENISNLPNIINIILNGENIGTYKTYLQSSYFQIMSAIAILGSTSFFKRKLIDNENQYIKLALDIFLCLVLYVVIIKLAKNTYNPFIYFRF